MQAEIIAIGSELTSGAKLDTNSQWLSVELSEIGIPVGFHATMADDPPAMLQAFQTAVQRSDLVLITGGLGPTLDDLTRQLIAELLGTELVLDEPSLQFITELFEKRGRVMAERNRIQAMFPAGSEPIPNPVGTAPGVWAEIVREGREPCLLAAMPGVPSEMKKMFDEQVRPKLPVGSRVIRRQCINTFGRGESDVEQILGDLTARGRNPEVGITASSATITLRLAAHGCSIEECDQALAETRATIEDKLGDLIFGANDDTLEGAVIDMLAARGETVSVIEWGSEGLLSQQLSIAAAGRDVFAGGIVTPSRGKLPAFAHVEVDGLHASKEDARTAAIACREQFNSDYALLISPFSTPDESTGVQHSLIALATPSDAQAHEHSILIDPAIARPRAVKAVVNLLRLYLLRAASGS